MNFARANAFGLIALACAAATPASAARLGYLHGDGPKAYPVVALTWGLLIISIIVVVIVSLLVLGGVWVRRAPVGDQIAQAPVARGKSGLPWLTWGVGVSSLVLLGSLVWTVVVLAGVNGPPTAPKLTIEVTGQQWFWKIRYLDSDPSEVFSTADEIHIPVGQPVRVKLIGADVIHSFWVPALSGKTDAVPGQTNETWLEASRAGTYWGACTQYCGEQHAHMDLLVIAQSPAAFVAWRAGQVEPAPVPTSAAIAAGEQAFVYHCGACHMVRGTTAGGTVAPDLTHLMSRRILAGGVLTNTIANLSGWIADPQSIKPDTRMPNLYLSGPQLQSIRSFLETLN
ncbi:MAG TPA: c-type cytochrome [Acetobacteraceae bacterium]